MRMQNSRWGLTRAEHLLPLAGHDATQDMVDFLGQPRNDKVTFRNSVVWVVFFTGSASKFPNYGASAFSI